MCLDLLRERSDDSFYTEEHILFLVSKMRALLLERKYKATRNSSYTMMSEANRQQICLDLEPAELLPNGCEGLWLKSTAKVPDSLSMSEPRVSVVNDLLHSVVNYIPAERMPYVGHNKWLQNIIYAARSNDGYLYLNSVNPQFINLEKIQMSGIFRDPEEAAKYSCDSNGESQTCDVMDMEFPLEDALIPQCIEMVVQELAGPRYAPEDNVNNDKDDLAGLAARTRAVSPAQRSTDELLREDRQ
jgi:hypothetical protein